MEKRRKYGKLVFMYKANHDTLPGYLQGLLPPTVGEIAQYELRNALDFNMPMTKKNYFLKSFIPSSIKAWNEASDDIKRATSLNSVKAKLSDLYGSTTYHLFLCEDGNGLLTTAE